MWNKDLIVEYIVVIDSKYNFCNSKDSFINLIKTNSNIEFNNESEILFNGITIKYNIVQNSLENNESVFDIEFMLVDEKRLSVYEEFIRSIKVILGKASGNVHTLRDDISFYYSQKSYPLVHKLENLMRKLITKFMITNIGLSWTEKHIPQKVQLSFKGDKKNNLNYLYDLDFIQLSAFLFDEYSNLKSEELLKQINKTNEMSELNLNTLKEYVPTSNWNRFFSEIVDSEQEQLEKKWSQLYNLRNKIAHNNLFSKSDYTNLCKLSNDVSKVLDRAISSLDQIKVTPKQKEILSNNIFHDVHENLSVFYESVSEMYNIFAKVIQFKGVSIVFNTFEDVVEYSLNNNLLQKELVEDARLIHDYYKLLISNREIFDDHKVKNYIQSVKNINKYIKENIIKSDYF